MTDDPGILLLLCLLYYIRLAEENKELHAELSLTRDRAWLAEWQLEQLQEQLQEQTDIWPPPRANECD